MKAKAAIILILIIAVYPPIVDYVVLASEEFSVGPLIVEHYQSIRIGLPVYSLDFQPDSYILAIGTAGVRSSGTSYIPPRIIVLNAWQPFHYWNYTYTSSDQYLHALQYVSEIKWSHSGERLAAAIVTADSPRPETVNPWSDYITGEAVILDKQGRELTRIAPAGFSISWNWNDGYVASPVPITSVSYTSLMIIYSSSSGSMYTAVTDNDLSSWIHRDVYLIGADVEFSNQGNWLALAQHSKWSIVLTFLYYKSTLQELSLGSVYYRSSVSWNYISAISWSPDDNMVAFGTVKGDLFIANTLEQAIIYEPLSLGDRILMIEWINDRTILVGAGSMIYRIILYADGLYIEPFDLAVKANAMALSSDGRLLAIAEGNVVHVYELTGSERNTIKPAPGASKDSSGSTGLGQDYDSNKGTSTNTVTGQHDNDINVVPISELQRASIPNKAGNPEKTEAYTNINYIGPEPAAMPSNITDAKDGNSPGDITSTASDRSDTGSGNGVSMQESQEDRDNEGLSLPSLEINVNNKMIVYVIIAYFVLKILRFVYR